MTERIDAAGRKKANRFFLIGIAGTLLFVVIAATVGAVAANSVRRKAAEKRAETVLWIGSRSVSRAEFELFCVTVIEGQYFEELDRGSASDNTLSLAVKAKAEEYAKQYVALKTEAENAGITLSPLERAEIDLHLESIKEKADDSFFVKNFGVTKEGYRSFLYGWKLCEKFVNSKAAEVEPDEALKKRVFDANAAKLGWAYADVIYFNTNISDTGAADLKRATAKMICDSVNGLPESEKEEVFRNYFESYNEEGFEGAGISVPLSGSIADRYPGLFDALRNAYEGYCYVVDDGIAAFAVRVRERFMYDYFCDSSELAALVQDEIRKTVVQSAISGGKYGVAESAAMDTVDIVGLLAQRKELYGS